MSAKRHTKAFTTALLIASDWKQPDPPTGEWANIFGIFILLNKARNKREQITNVWNNMDEHQKYLVHLALDTKK